MANISGHGRVACDDVGDGSRCAKSEVRLAGESSIRHINDPLPLLDSSPAALYTVDDCSVFVRANQSKMAMGVLDEIDGM